MHVALGHDCGVGKATKLTEEDQLKVVLQPLSEESPVVDRYRKGEHVHACTCIHKYVVWPRTRVRSICCIWS